MLVWYVTRSTHHATLMCEREQASKDQQRGHCWCCVPPRVCTAPQPKPTVVVDGVYSFTAAATVLARQDRDDRSMFLQIHVFLGFFRADVTCWTPFCPFTHYYKYKVFLIITDIMTHLEEIVPILCVFLSCVLFSVCCLSLLLLLAAVVVAGALLFRVVSILQRISAARKIVRQAGKPTVTAVRRSSLSEEP